MKTRLILLIGLAITLLCSPGLASAQDVQIIPISYGQTLTGELATADDVLVYGFDGKAGDVVTITTTPGSKKLQTVVMLFTIDGTEVASSDKGVITKQPLDADLVYLILVGSAKGTGEFTI